MGRETAERLINRALEPYRTHLLSSRKDGYWPRHPLKSPSFKQKHGPCRHTWHTFGTFPRVHGMCHREVHQPLFPRHHTCHTLPILLGGPHTWGILSLVEVQALPRVSLSTSDSNMHAHQCGLLSLRTVQGKQSRFPRSVSHSGGERV